VNKEKSILKSDDKKGSKSIVDYELTDIKEPLQVKKLELLTRNEVFVLIENYSTIDFKLGF